MTWPVMLDTARLAERGEVCAVGSRQTGPYGMASPRRRQRMDDLYIIVAQRQTRHWMSGTVG